jgi:hypothetical protein
MKRIDSFQNKALSQQEMRTMNGGWYLFAIGITLAMINDAQNNPDDFREGAAAWGY